MGNLIKYEFRKTWIMKGIILAITAIFQLMIIGGIFTESDEWVGIGSVMYILTAICSVFIIGIFSIFTLNKDLNTKQSYMLFMTPHSSFSILGAKLIENGGSIIISGAFFVVLALFDGTLAAAKYGQFKAFVELLEYFFESEVSVDRLTFALSCGVSLFNWVMIVTIGYFAVVISSTFLNGRKFNGLVSFIIFLFITIFTSRLSSKLIYISDIVEVEELIIAMAFELVVAIVMYAISAWIMDNKLSV